MLLAYFADNKATAFILYGLDQNFQKVPIVQKQLNFNKINAVLLLVARDLVGVKFKSRFQKVARRLRISND
jgi:hypothetical protein